MKHSSPRPQWTRGLRSVDGLTGSLPSCQTPAGTEGELPICTSPQGRVGGRSRHGLADMPGLHAPLQPSAARGALGHRDTPPVAPHAGHLALDPPTAPEGGGGATGLARRAGQRGARGLQPTLGPGSFPAGRGDKQAASAHVPASPRRCRAHRGQDTGSPESPQSDVCTTEPPAQGQPHAPRVTRDLLTRTACGHSNSREACILRTRRPLPAPRSRVPSPCRALRADGAAAGAAVPPLPRPGVSPQGALWSRCAQ